MTEGGKVVVVSKTTSNEESFLGPHITGCKLDISIVLN